MNGLAVDKASRAKRCPGSVSVSPYTLPGDAAAGRSAIAAIYSLVLIVLVAGCGAPDTSVFRRLAPAETGIGFVNTLSSSSEFNILNYLYYYDGGGVAAGDINGDGLPDLYFTANEGPNQLYLNLGNLRFENVTEKAGVSGDADWTTGVTMADVDGDGLLDIYVSVASGFENRRGRNQLFINNGDLTFTESAAAFGLDFAGYGTQAVFFDYDLDGDLDAYLLNHSTHFEDTYHRASIREEPHPTAGDRLYRNDEGRFVDVSRAAGIYSGVTGYGLGVVATDINLDGCPDLFVANDFHENDFLYVNNCDGTFTESIRQFVGYTSLSSMGTDAADFNNDGFPDLVVLDMLPDREDVLKTAAGPEPSDIHDIKVRFGYHHQHARNMLYVNLGGERFSEIGQFAGIEATDWSWAPLFADFDNDGRKDLFVTNGILRRPNDQDYIAYVSVPSRQAALEDGIDEEDLAIIAHMPQVAVPNYLFRNDGNLAFSNVAAEWGLAEPFFSNGAAYADLDNDGDLDLILNNVDAPAGIYRSEHSESANRYLRVVLEGTAPNSFGVGAKVLLYSGGDVQLQEAFPTRGFQSSVDPRLHFGVGAAETIDSLIVIWPDGRYQRLVNIASNSEVTLRQEASEDTPFDYRRLHAHTTSPLFEDANVVAPYRHTENRFNDFRREPLKPWKVSTEGPALAVGDADGDGLDDLFVGGARGQPAALLFQDEAGTFRRRGDAPWQSDSPYEDVDAAFFDADGDGDLDLYVVSAGGEQGGRTETLRDRLYLNEGGGTFTRGLLPEFHENGSVVRPHDFDGDGRIDLFVGGRVVAGAYGKSPRSVLLKNEGDGFTDVTDSIAPGLREAGMITDAVWTDGNGDGLADLIVVGEWMAPRLFVQDSGRLVEADEVGFEGLSGWWQSVTAADLDGDGDEDLIFGNHGLNSRVRATLEEPARLYVGALRGGDTIRSILTSFRHGKEYPLAGRDELLAGLPALARTFPTYAAMAEVGLEDLLTSAGLDGADVLEARTLASAVAMNEGGRYVVRPLPAEAQFSPVATIVANDFDNDGIVDLVVGGNFYGAAPPFGRFDASYGLYLRGEGDGSFEPLPPHESGLILRGEIRALRTFRTSAGTRLLVAARTNETLQFVEVKTEGGELTARTRR